MAKFYIQYSASATPIEELIATDTSQSSRLVHSSIDKTIGGGIEIDCATTATNVRYKNITTTVDGGNNDTLSDLLGVSISNIDFLMVKITEAVDADNDPLTYTHESTGANNNCMPP